MIQNNIDIPQGYKDSALGVIPQEWEVRTLGKIVNIQSGNSPSLFNFHPQGKFPYIKVEDMNNCDKYQMISRNYSNEDQFTIPPNSVIFPKRGAAIMNNKVRINSCMIQMDSNMMAIIPNQAIVDSEFLYYKIKYEKLYKIADTSTIPQINNKHIFPYKLALPFITEQEKIAEILGVWDIAIEKQGALVNALTRRKRALMQQLLTAKKRLPNFTEPWEMVKLKDVFTEIKTINNGDCLYPAMTISAKRGLISQESKFDRVIAGNSLSKYTLLEREDFAYNKGNSKTYPMGCIYKLESDEKALVPFVYICFRGNDSVVTNFYKQWFANKGLDRQLNQIITSGARGDGLLNVNTTAFFNLNIPLLTIPEQQAIAEVLSTSDQELELAKKRLKAFRTQKSALMQQLLTGKKRVKI